MQGFARDPELTLCEQVGYRAAPWVDMKVEQTPSPGIVDRFGLDVEQIIPMHGRLATLGEARTVAQTFRRSQVFK